MNFKTTFLFSLLAIMLCSACEQQPNAPLPDYGTESDSARFYFLKGWQEILDYGRWTKSEEAFRKAVTFDPDWLLGQSLVGRITRDTEEREKLLDWLEQEKERASPDERPLLDVNLLSMQAANNRDRGIANPAEFNSMRRKLAEMNFGNFARKYPEDDYFKAEYIEFLHANHGARVALDSINVLANERQKKLLFYIIYAGSMELELDSISDAMGRTLPIMLTPNFPEYNSPMVYNAQILMAQDSLVPAKRLIDKVVERDPNHLIAIGMQTRLAKLLEDK